jgi:hypothetical protein
MGCVFFFIFVDEIFNFLAGVECKFNMFGLSGLGSGVPLSLAATFRNSTEKGGPLVERLPAGSDAKENETLFFMIYDFAPQMLASPAYRFFLSEQKAIYIVTFSLMSSTAVDDVEELRVFVFLSRFSVVLMSLFFFCRWLSAIELHVTLPNVLLVGCFKDRVESASSVALSVFDAFRRRKKSRVLGCLAVDALRDVSEVRARLKKIAMEMEAREFLGHTFSRSIARLGAVLRADGTTLSVPCISHAKLGVFFSLFFLFFSLLLICYKVLRAG